MQGHVERSSIIRKGTKVIIAYGMVISTKKKRTESKKRFDRKCQQNVEGLEMRMHNY